MHTWTKHNDKSQLNKDDIVNGFAERSCPGNVHTFSNRSLTREAPTPTNSSTNSDAAHEKNGTPASPAMALASSVLPVPGPRHSSYQLLLAADICTFIPPSPRYVDRAVMGL